MAANSSQHVLQLHLFRHYQLDRDLVMSELGIVLGRLSFARIPQIIRNLISHSDISSLKNE